MHTRILKVFEVLGKSSFLAFAAFFLCCPDASAQQWPSKPLRIIVPVPPGGATDIIVRLISERLSPALGQQIVVENRPGAGTMIGSEVAARSAPDGYTFLAAGSSALAINPHLYANMGYNPLRDFVPITQLVSIDFVLCAHPALPVRTVTDLVKLAGVRPGEITYGSYGNGTTNHIAMALFGSMNNIKLTHVPYKGSAPALTDLVGGHISLLLDAIAAVQAQLKAGKIRPIGVTALKRSPLLPEVPTFDEQGVKGFVVNTWTGLVAPTGSPVFVLDRMNAETAKIIRMPEVRQRIQDMGMVPIGDSREQFSAYISSEFAKWAAAVKISGARVE